MAGEYYRWLARNEKPREKREMTKKEKWTNWWYYHKWHVLTAVVVVLALVSLVSTAVSNITHAPDYQIAYVGRENLDDETVAALESRFAELGGDLNGDGEVRVRVNQYMIYADTESGIQDGYGSYGGKVQLMADFSEGYSFFFLLEDPAGFQTDFGALAYLDGTVPQGENTVDDGMWIACGDCAALADLDLDGLYLARRIFVEEPENLADWEALWNQILG